MTSAEKQILVFGPQGAVGTIDRSEWATESPRLYLTLGDGRRVLLRREMLSARDNNLHLTHDVVAPHDTPPPPAVGLTPAATVLPVAQEELTIGKTVVENRVRVTKTVHEREVVVDPPLLHENVEVERVRIDRVIDHPAQVRQDGDVTIVPVMEEVYVVEKRLMLREEVRLTKRRTETHDPQTMRLKYEEIAVERIPDASVTHGNVPGEVPQAVTAGRTP